MNENSIYITYILVFFLKANVATSTVVRNCKNRTDLSQSKVKELAITFTHRFAELLSTLPYFWRNVEDINIVSELSSPPTGLIKSTTGIKSPGYMLSTMLVSWLFYAMRMGARVQWSLMLLDIVLGLCMKICAQLLDIIPTVNESCHVIKSIYFRKVHTWKCCSGEHGPTTHFVILFKCLTTANVKLRFIFCSPHICAGEELIDTLVKPEVESLTTRSKTGTKHKYIIIADVFSSKVFLIRI